MEENKVPVPAGLSERQKSIAEAYAKDQMKDGFTIGGFCTEQGISTKTFYSTEYKENALFTQYVNSLVDKAIPEDEMAAFRKMKRHLLKFAEKENPTTKEMQMFFEAFDYIREADKRQQMERLGLSNSPANNSGSTKSIEERKASLLERLRK